MRIIVLLSVTALVLMLGATMRSPRSEAAISNLIIDVRCSSNFGGTAVATFSWTGNHPSALQQWLDLSRFNNGWQPGTFSGAGPFAAAETSFVWDGLPTGMYLYARHNQYFSNGAWDTSRTYWLYTPSCGGAAPSQPAGQPSQPTIQPQQPATQLTGCHPSYFGGQDAETGGCIRSGNVDYDCFGSRGNGPRYATGNATIIGEDQYGLDGFPRNGIACDSVN